MSVNRFGDILRGDPNAVGADGTRQAYAQQFNLDVDGWTSRYVGKGIYELRPRGTYPGKMLMTAAAVTVDAALKANHRLVRFEWKHLDENLADGTDATAAILSRDDYVPLGAILWRLYYEAASVASTTVVPFGEGYEYVACTYRLSFNTTNGDWIVPILWVQELKP